MPPSQSFSTDVRAHILNYEIRNDHAVHGSNVTLFSRDVKRENAAIGLNRSPARFIGSAAAIRRVLARVVVETI